MICVIATIRVRAGQRESFLRIFHELMPKVHAEAGCLEYFPTIDVDAGIDVQGALRDDIVTILEKWESIPALQAHLAAPHMHAFRDSVAGIVEDLQLQIVEPPS